MFYNSAKAATTPTMAAEAGLIDPKILSPSLLSADASVIAGAGAAELAAMLDTASDIVAAALLVAAAEAEDIIAALVMLAALDMLIIRDMLDTLASEEDVIPAAFSVTDEPVLIATSLSLVALEVVAATEFVPSSAPAPAAATCKPFRYVAASLVRLS